VADDKDRQGSGRESAGMTAVDWPSYDGIAARYDDVWGSRFEAVARLIWERVPPGPGALILDIGTGTGIVPRAMGGARLSDISGVTGCDRSAGMLSMAKARLPALRLVAAGASALPFAPAVFDVATASFVLSHLRDYGAGLLEAHRVLKPGGTFVMTSWAADTEAPGEAWRELLAEAVSSDRLQEAVAQVAPSESCLETAAAVEQALTKAAFSGVEAHAATLECRLSLEDYLADRELGAGGRFARHALGAAGWARFLAHAREDLGRRFGPLVSVPRGVLVGIGRA
jgi:ubiquinone/menaquinone biosynthesis C-methylase UbiE